MKHGVSCIIAAFNEESRISSVLDAVIKCADINEIIVVNDGSTDGTSTVLRKYPKCKIVDLKKNSGKANAISLGVSLSQFDTLLLVDSDLRGLRPRNLSDLIDPVLKDPKCVTLSTRRNSLWPYLILGIDFVTGERVMPRKYFKALGDVSNTGYALETIMNRHLLENNIPFKSIFWPNVYHTQKKDKIGLVPGTLADLKMIKQIHNEQGVDQLIIQFFQMAYKLHSTRIHG